MVRHEVVDLPGGWRGTDMTVEWVNRLVEDSLTDPLVVLTAQNIVRHLPERDKDAEIAAISNFIRTKIRYTNEGVETLKTPHVVLSEIKQHGKAVGDCDDAVITWLALHRAVGSKARIKVISQRKNQIANHIYGQVWSPRRGWVTDDTIVKHQPVGWEASQKNVTKSKTYMNGLSGLGEANMDNGVFHPGGTQQMYSDDMIPETRYQMGHAASRYNVKTGGMLTVDENGDVEGVGQDIVASIKSLFAAAPAKDEKEEPAKPPTALEAITGIIGTGAGIYAKLKEQRDLKKLLKQEAEARRARARAAQQTDLSKISRYVPPTPPPVTYYPPPKKEGIPTELLIGGGVALLALVFLLK